MSQSFVPPFAPIAVLALLGTAMVTAGLVLAAGAALAFRRRRLAAILGAGALTVACGYTAILLVFSFGSADKTLRRGDRKYFCEIDCHVAYFVRDFAVERRGAKERYVVSVVTWFDPDTISSTRGDSSLEPNPREVYVVDAGGRRYPPSPEIAAPGSTPMTTTLRPGESYATRLVFDLPIGARAPRLFVGDPTGPEIALFDHENSPFHGKVYFALDTKSALGGSGH